jgi:putative protein-disulfide isomerase
MLAKTHLIYFADPMCSWCWGFAPVIRAIQERWGEDLPVRVVMGGLRPGSDRPMTASAKAEVRQHWEHVAEASGQPFDLGFFEREGFVYDTDPAARAVVAARATAPERALDFLERTQAAFYAEGRDVTTEAVLGEVAAETGLEREAFLERWRSPDTQEETWRDYAISRRTGVTGFPTMVAGPDAGGTYALVTQGFQRGEVLIPALEAWLSQARS